MDEKARIVRKKLRSMAPKEAMALIRGAMLPEEEERFLIEHEARGKSVVEIALENHVSVETVHKRRRAALRKIAAEKE